MSIAAELAEQPLVVAPGAEVRTEVQLRNTGSVVDQFSLEVLGESTGWTTVEPETINLLPDGQATATLIFAPPRSAEVPAGPASFAVRVSSREDPAGSVVEEGTVTVEPFVELAAELVPTQRRGRRRAKYRLALDNTGNTEVATVVHAVDEDDELRLVALPQVLRAQPGTTTVVLVKAAPHKRFLRGQPKTLPFQVVVAAQEEGQLDQPLTADGVMTQEQLIPKWLLPAMLALVALIGGLIAFWFAVLKPTVQSVAREQVQPQVERAEKAAQQANRAADKAETAAQGGAPGANAGALPNGNARPPAADGATGDNSASDNAAADSLNDPGTGQSSRNTNSANANRAPVSFRVAADANPVTDGSFQDFSYLAPAGKSLDIGDLVLQNPRGDTGLLRVVIGGNVILEAGMANFRDLDYHYLNPLHAEPGQPVTVSVSCGTPGSGAPRCTPSVSFSGVLGG